MPPGARQIAAGPHHEHAHDEHMIALDRAEPSGQGGRGCNRFHSSRLWSSSCHDKQVTGSPRQYFPPVFSRTTESQKPAPDYFHVCCLCTSGVFSGECSPAQSLCQRTMHRPRVGHPGLGGGIGNQTKDIHHNSQFTTPGLKLRLTLPDMNASTI